MAQKHTFHGKEYINTKMCVWLVNRFGEKSPEWHRVFGDDNGNQYIKVNGRMARLEEYRIHSVASL